MTATTGEARFVFDEWHRLVTEHDGAALAALYTDDAVLESPLVPRLLDNAESGIVRGRAELDAFLALATARKPVDEELPLLYRRDTFAFDGKSMIWEYPRETPNGDQLDLVEVMELDGPRIRRHRIYWGWRGTEHIIANALRKHSSL